MSQHVQNNLMTGARQTMSAWSKVLTSREEIPAVYKKRFDEYFDTERSFPNVVFTPSLDRFPRKTTEKLICDTQDVLHIFERIGNQVDVSCYPYRDIGWVEIGIILLDSWLSISGKTDHGESRVFTIQFNTSSMRHFATILNKLRPAMATTDKTRFAAEKEKFNTLAEANFKFMNYGRESLVPGETVLQMLLQKEIREPRFTILSKTFYRTLSLAHLSIITDRELILIQDSERGKESQVSRYGGVWQYIPLHCIDAVTLSDSANDKLNLSIRLHPEKTIAALFEATTRAELDEFCFTLRSLIEHAGAVV